MVSNLLGERFSGMRIPAWRQLGVTVDPETTATEAFRLAGLNYRYHSLPIGVTLPNGEFVSSTDDVAVYREPTPIDPEWRNLGVVSGSYRYMQNEDLAKGIDSIMKKTGWTFESAGGLGDGKTVFAVLKTGKHSIHGDEIDSFFIISDGKSANRALRIMAVAFRLICTNGMVVPDYDSLLAVSIPHASNVGAEYSFWLELISDLEKAQVEAFADLRLMGSTRITDDVAQRIFRDAFPDPVMNQRVKLSGKVDSLKITEGRKEEAKGALSSAVQAYEYNLAQANRWRNGAQELYERFNSGNEQGGAMSGAALKRLQGTAYGALQAVTEICDWGGTDRSTVAGATLFGARAAQKERAWKSALQISQASIASGT